MPNPQRYRVSTFTDAWHTDSWHSAMERINNIRGAVERAMIVVDETTGAVVYVIGHVNDVNDLKKREEQP